MLEEYIHQNLNILQKITNHEKIRAKQTSRRIQSPQIKKAQQIQQRGKKTATNCSAVLS
jgi:hypothetical protein